MEVIESRSKYENVFLKIVQDHGKVQDGKTHLPLSIRDIQALFIKELGFTPSTSGVQWILHKHNFVAIPPETPGWIKE